MQSINIKWLAATDTKPSRIKATTSGGESITLCTSNNLFDSCVSDESKCTVITSILMNKLEWRYPFVIGSWKEEYYAVLMSIN